LKQTGQSILLPPLWDHHGHLCALGALSEELDLRDTPSPEALLQKLKENARRKNPGEWILGFGWDHNLWAGKSPDLEDIDKATAGAPLFVRRIDGHAAIANTLSLKLAGLNSGSEIKGGRLLQNRGVWNGIVIETAMAPFLAAISSPSETIIRGRLLKAFSILESYCLSGATDMQLKDDEISALEEMDERGELKFPVLGYKEWNPGENIPRKLYSGKRFRLEGIKVFLDGALGSRGAALREPYSDDETARGFLLLNRRQILEILKEAEAKKIGLAFHMIGDQALEEFLAAYEKTTAPGTDVRIEHLLVTPKDLLKRLASADVTVSLQPCQYLSDRAWAPERLGTERAGCSYLLRSIIRGKKYLLGTDFPIESPDPLRTIAACFSVSEKEKPGFKDVIKGMTCPPPFKRSGSKVRLSGYDENGLLNPENILSWEFRRDG
jgi:predicted amidohydrolase YtcJ